MKAKGSEQIVFGSSFIYFRSKQSIRLHFEQLENQSCRKQDKCKNGCRCENNGIVHGGKAPYFLSEKRDSRNF